MADLMKTRYSQHRSNAKKRGISFELTLEEWSHIWLESGHWNDRKNGGYVMARTNDVGPYALGNVRICHHLENTAEPQVLCKMAQTMSTVMTNVLARPDIKAKYSAPLKAARARTRKEHSDLRRISFSQEQLDEIKAKKAGGQTGKSLAEEYGVGTSTIFRVLNDTWAVHRGW